MADRVSIFTTPIRTLDEWARGEELTARKLNQAITAVNKLLPPVPAPRQLRKVKGYGNAKGSFDWALLRKVEVTTPLIEVQRIKYTDESPTEYWEAYSETYPYHTYRKIAVYGSVVTAYPAPGTTYETFNVPLAIRRVEDIDPQTGEKMGWTIYPVKLYGDMTIEWAWNVPPGLVVVDPEDEFVSA